MIHCSKTNDLKKVILELNISTERSSQPKIYIAYI